MDEVGRSSASEGEAKPERARTFARGRVVMLPSTARLVESHALKKGDVLTAARFAGVQAAKSAPQYLARLSVTAITSISVDFVVDESGVAVCVGVDGDDTLDTAMLALTGATVACLTIFDMCKAVDRTMTIGPIHVEESPRAS